ncbi:MAG TPA: winged helix DNA-binding domain-containing protein, partial [Polyangiales bacterium]|nr:winged helix DNA-binding domain-containing protein [Polyangiales bacterium]
MWWLRAPEAMPAPQTHAAIAKRRLINERLIGALFRTPEEVVESLCAVQAQDYLGALWALGQRLPTSTESDVEKAFQAGRILRTHVLRPTWHFVLPADIAWLLELTAPRIKAVSAYYLRKEGLDDAKTVLKSQRVLARALEGGQFLTREELVGALADAGIQAAGLRLGYLLILAELDAVICSGPRRGKQFTYASFEERVPAVPKRSRAEALAELAQRYVGSHGPATIHDLAWWSGLSVTDAKRAVAACSPALESCSVEGKTFWFCSEQRSARMPTPCVHLLPNYDEFLIAYKHHEVTLAPNLVQPLGRENNVF